MPLKENIKKMRDQMVVPPAICVERAKYMTESYKMTEGQPIWLRRAKALAHIYRHMTIRIDEGDLFAGNFTSKIRGGAVIPEMKAQWLLDEFDTLSTRPFDKYQPLEPEEVEVLKEVLPYWKGKAAFDLWSEMIPDWCKELDHIMTASGGYCENGHHWAHTAVNYEHYLQVGCKGVIKEANDKLNSLQYDNPGDIEKANFWKAVIIIHEGFIDLAHRYAMLAKELAKNEKDKNREWELNRIYRTLMKVPEYPAESFFEAVQACWLLHVAVMIEGWGAGPTLGRADQYLYPYYQKSKADGEITDEEVYDLWTLIFIKMNGGINLQSYVIADGKGGHPTMQSVCVGGVTPDGRDAVNELSYIILAAEGDVGLGAEDVMVRINRLNPDSYVKFAVETAKKLGGKIKFVSDDTSIPAMLTLGVPLEKARDYVSTGCHNPTVPHFSRNTGGGACNGGLALELALNNGYSHILKKQIGPETGDPKYFKTYNEVKDAFMTQLKAGMHLMIVNKHADVKAMANYPCILLSSLYDPCMEKGIDDYNGGCAPFMTFAIGIIGMPNVGDSLAALKKVVFEEKKATMEDVVNALDANFEGYEWLLHLFDKVPKYGNDIDYVDNIVKDLLSEAADYVGQFTTRYGAKFATACYAMTTNVMFGRITGALPDGRKSGWPLSEGGISPYQGRNTSGITATMNSVAKIDQVKMTLGSILNMRIAKSAVNNEQKVRALTATLRTFCEKGGNLVQFNFADNETLRAAQKNPELYKDLLVRVATYSAFFVELGEETQEDIIQRNELY